MSHNHSHSSSGFKTCGFTLLMAAGCQQPPEWAEKPTDAEIQAHNDAIQLGVDHLDFVRDILVRADPKLRFVSDKSIAEPTPDDVIADFEEVLVSAQELADAGNVYVYRGSDFPDEDLAEAAGYAKVRHLAPHKEFTVYLEHTIDSVQAIIHENEHLLTNKGHSKEVDTELETVDSPSVSVVAESRDLAYRDSITFDAFETLHWSMKLEYTGVSDINYLASSGYYQDPYAAFQSDYIGIESDLALLQNDPHAWATEAVDGMFFDPEDNPYEAGGEFLISIGLSQDDLAELLTLPSTQYLRDEVKEKLENTLQDLQEHNPELYQRYRNEQRADNIVEDRVGTDRRARRVRLW